LPHEIHISSIQYVTDNGRNTQRHLKWWGGEREQRHSGTADECLSIIKILSLTIYICHLILSFCLAKKNRHRFQTLTACNQINLTSLIGNIYVKVFEKRWRFYFCFRLCSWYSWALRRPCVLLPLLVSHCIRHKHILALIWITIRWCCGFPLPETTLTYSYISLELNRAF